MYRSHYDFRHFLAMSLSPLLIEVIVRLGYFAKRRREGCSVSQAVPFELPGAEPKPKLRTMLFSAHLVATAANAGKVALGQNPLLINFSQWVAFFCYAVPQVHWALVGKENAERSSCSRCWTTSGGCWTLSSTPLGGQWRGHRSCWGSHDGCFDS